MCVDVSVAASASSTPSTVPKPRTIEPPYRIATACACAPMSGATCANMPGAYSSAGMSSGSKASAPSAASAPCRPRAAASSWSFHNLVARLRWCSTKVRLRSSAAMASRVSRMYEATTSDMPRSTSAAARARARDRSWGVSPSAGGAGGAAAADAAPLALLLFVFLALPPPPPPASPPGPPAPPAAFVLPRLLKCTPTPLPSSTAMHTDLRDGFEPPHAGTSSYLSLATGAVVGMWVDRRSGASGCPRQSVSSFIGVVMLVLMFASPRSSASSTRCAPCDRR
mmetsp:Transcript_2975/g.10641  ORF Transcript_2975/g.10641 Transcript_2975/m.10641 type:complete len:282 (+) Transcript_2975:880-1725(+)